MRLIETSIAPSHIGTDFITLKAAIALERRAVTLRYEFELPADLARDLSPAGDPWAVLMLPLAAHFHEPIRLDRPLDTLLKERLISISKIWSSWYPQLKPVTIEAPEAPAQAAEAVSSRKTLSCFSGGIDSFFTLLRHDNAVCGDGTTAINECFAIAGFNTGMNDFCDMRDYLTPTLEKFGRRLIPIRTNLRYGAQEIATPYSSAHQMVGFAHGAALAGIAHLLAGRYRELIIPASHHLDNLMPYGSHPATDPLYSSSTLRVVHDGAAFSRVERTRKVGTSSEALATLHVCWQDYADGNCSKCQKCLRTMAALDLLGCRDHALSFDWSSYSMKTLSRIWLTNESDAVHFKELAAEGRLAGRDDIVQAAQACVRFSAYKRGALGLINSNAVSRLSWQAIRSLRNELQHNQA